MRFSRVGYIGLPAFQGFLYLGLAAFFFWAGRKGGQCRLAYET